MTTNVTLTSNSTANVIAGTLTFNGSLVLGTLTKFGAGGSAGWISPRIAIVVATELGQRNANARAGQRAFQTSG